jgi:cystathionine gamma-lyase
MRIGTKVIHAGVHPDPSTGSVMTPIYQTSTYAQEEPGVHKGYAYARSSNPTRTALESNLAALENGKYAFTFGSGMAAMDAVIRLFDPGAEILCTNDLYGGSYRQLTKVHERFGVKGRFVDMTDLKLLENSIHEQTSLIWIETPTNPMLGILDIKAICALARKKGVLVCVDNTFASPYLQTPLDLGADIVMHSCTKYLGGHSDVVMGALILNDQNLASRLAFLQNSIGAIPGPQDCFLMLRGIKTLHLRVQRSCENAREIADFLNTHSAVENVYYPGFEDHKGHNIAKEQMRDFGGMISFDLKGGLLEDAFTVMKKTKLFTLAESLGGVESLIGHPATMTHAAIPKADRLKLGLTDSLIRLSIGVEDVRDLKDDLGQALDIQA